MNKLGRQFIERVRQIIYEVETQPKLCDGSVTDAHLVAFQILMLLDDTGESNLNTDAEYKLYANGKYVKFRHNDL